MLFNTINAASGLNYQEASSTHSPYRRSKGHVFAVFVGAFLLNLWIQGATGGIPGVDGYFHIKFASLTRHAPFETVDRWLPDTIFANFPLNHHLLFHWTMIPFTYGSLIQGAKWYAIITATLVFLLFFLLMRRVSPWPFLLTSMLVLSSGFLFRLQLPRVQSLSLILLLLIVYSLLENKPYLLAVCSFLCSWAVLTGSLLGILPVVLYSIVHFGQSTSRRFRLARFGISGFGLGHILFPHFPSNIPFVYYYLLDKMRGLSVHSSGEWLSYGVYAVVWETGPIFTILLGLTAYVFVCRRIPVTRDVVFLITLVMVIFVLVLNSRRFIEFWPPIAILLIGEILRLIKFRRNEGLFVKCVIITFIVVFGVQNVLLVREGIKRDVNQLSAFEGSAEWLKTNTGSGEKVFLARWDYFPVFFFLNSSNSYVSGLDESYLYNADTVKWKVYRDVTSGGVVSVGDALMATFGVRYIFITPSDIEMLHRVLVDPELSVAYYDEGGMVVQIVK
jgi:hypothetical protein